MVIIELIGSISLVIAFISVIALTIIHIKNKQNNITYIHDHSLNNIEQSTIKTNCLNEESNQTSLALPFEKSNQDSSIVSPSNTDPSKELSITNVIQTDEISSSSIKYGIQWTLLSNKDEQLEINKSLPNILKTSEFEQGDSLSYSNQTINVRNLIEKFENNSIGKFPQNEKNNQTDSDVTSIDTNFDRQTIKIDFNQNQQIISHHSSISGLDVTIPSNLSSSIDLEQFENFSTTSNLSEFLNNH